MSLLEAGGFGAFRALRIAGTHGGKECVTRLTANTRLAICLRIHGVGKNVGTVKTRIPS